MKLLTSRELLLVAATTLVAVVVMWLVRSRDGVSLVLECAAHDSPQSQDESSSSTSSGSSRISYYKSQICQPRDLDSKCTLLVPTFRRVKILPLVLDNYCNMSDSLEKMVVVWNDIGSPIPPSLLKLAEKCKTELAFIPMTENKLSNRFLPGKYLKEIDTECKCTDLAYF